MKKIKLTSIQYNKLVNLISEERIILSEGDAPVDLKALLDDNKGTSIISFIRGDGNRVNFRLNTDNGHTTIKNITPKAIYDGFIGQFRPATMVYGNKVIIHYDSSVKTDPNTGQVVTKDGSWKDTLTDVIKIEIYDQSLDLLDSMELEGDSDDSSKLPVDDRVKQFNAEFKKMKVHQRFKIVGKQTYDGDVLTQQGGAMTFELTNASLKNAILGEFQFTTDDKGVEDGIFIIANNGEIGFQATKFIKQTRSNLIINSIKNFVVVAIPKTPEEIEQERLDKEKADADAKQQADDEARKKSDDDARTDSEKRSEEAKEAKKMAKDVYDLIINDPVLKKAFFHQPSLMGMIKMGVPQGIVPAKEIINKYINKSVNSKLGDMAKKFPVNSTVTFEVVGNDMKINDTDYVAPVGRTFKAIVKQREIGNDFIALVHKKDATDPEFFIELHKPDDLEKNDDIYPALIKTEQRSSTNQFYGFNKSDMGQIRITNYKFR